MFGGLLKSTSRLALVAAASVVGGISAQAADLGGNCCADLEERVAELEATTARKGNRKVSLTVSGIIDKSIVWHDSNLSNSFRRDQVTVREGDLTGTKFRFVGAAKVTSDVTFGYTLELGIGENFEPDTNIATFNATQGLASVLIRQSHFFATSKTYGQLAVGQLSVATDGIYQINLSNAKTCVGCDLEGTMMGSRMTGVFAIDGVLDGGRLQGMRYTSPTFAGFVASAGFYQSNQDWSTTNGNGASSRDTREEWDVALRYAGEFNGIRLAAGVGYREVNAITVGSAIDTQQNILAGSASVMHLPTGLFVSGGYGEADSDTLASQRDGMWVMAGIEKNFFGIGNTTVYGEYLEANFGNLTAGACDAATANTAVCRKDGTAWGLGLVQKVDAAATDFYVSYRRYESDALVNVTTGQIQNITAVVAGVNINF